MLNLPNLHGYGNVTPSSYASNVFLNSIGQVGNAIRTGYQATTGFVSNAFNNITSSITKGFSNMGKGNNLWSKVSDGAKSLFQKSRAAVQKFKPMTSKGGSVDVKGFGYSPHSDFVTSSMSNTQAAQLLESGADSLASSWFLQAMYNDWKKIKGYNKLDPKENEGQLQSSFKDFDANIKSCT